MILSFVRHWSYDASPVSPKNEKLDNPVLGMSKFPSALPERSGILNPSNVGTVVASLFIFAAGFVYVSAFWSRLPGYLPAPLHRLSFVHVQLIGDWWHRNIVPAGPAYRSDYLLWAANSVVVGLLIPLALLGIVGTSPKDMGLGRPNVLGARFIWVAVLLSAPLGLWLLADQPAAIAEVWDDFRYKGLCGGIAMIPEHFLICGIMVALLLPERRLPLGVPLAPVEGTASKRLLRWLGLAQEVPVGGGVPWLAWWGLSPAAFAAIVGSGFLFLVVHIGEPGLEVLLSFPGGTAVAYMTLRCRSIWPGLLAHFALNLIPLGIWLLFRS
jgi:hypothetical protein